MSGKQGVFHLAIPCMVRDLLLGHAFQRDQAYPAGIRYKFLLPRTVYSYLQLCVAAGTHGIRDPQRYRRTFYDTELTDPVPALLRIPTTLKSGTEPLAS